MPILTQAEIEDKLRGEDLDAWLDLWRAEQGPAKPGSLKLMAAAIPFPAGQDLHVLDACCGPGDAGRTIHSGSPNSRIDFVDRALFFSSLCAAVNRRDGIPGRTLVRDLSKADWRRGLENDYDVVVIANALHWFRMERAAELLSGLFELLRPGGVFLLLEPVSPESRFAPGFNTWKKDQPSQHKQEDFIRFWSRVKTLLGYDHLKQLGDRDDRIIGDKLTVLGFVGLLKDAGFESIDVLLRDSEKVVVAAAKP
jgi:SAM-dependent methyltransferase